MMFIKSLSRRVQEEEKFMLIREAKTYSPDGMFSDD